MSALVNILRAWNQRQKVQQELERSGYVVHDLYQREVATFALVNGKDGSDLQHYWSECAREWMACAGQVDCWARNFYGDIGYRSEYLDTLALQRSEVGLGSTLPLHPAERAFMESLESPSGPGLKITEMAETQKAVARVLQLPELTRSSSVNDLVDYFYSRLTGFGFLRKAGTIKFVAENGLCFDVGIEKGRSKNIYQINVFLKIWHDSEVNTDFYIGDFRNIVPGFPYYSIVQNDWDVIYGLDAHACLICALCQSMRLLNPNKRGRG